jgi:hypothetical protein
MSGDGFPVITVGPLSPREEPEWRVHIQWRDGEPTLSHTIERATELAETLERQGDNELARRLRDAVENARAKYSPGS